MSKVDFFGHWFYFFLFIGMLLLQSKDYRGWAFRFAGEVGWIGIGLVIGMSSVWLWGFAFLVVDVLGYFKWQKEQEELAAFEREQAEWLEAGAAAVALTEDPGLEYVKRLQADHDRIEAEQFYYWSTKFDALKEKTDGKNKDKQRKSKRARVAKTNRKPANRKVRATGRRSRK